MKLHRHASQQRIGMTATLKASRPNLPIYSLLQRIASHLQSSIFCLPFLNTPPTPQVYPRKLYANRWSTTEEAQKSAKALNVRFANDSYCQQVACIQRTSLVRLTGIPHLDPVRLAL